MTNVRVIPPTSPPRTPRPAPARPARAALLAAGWVLLGPPGADAAPVYRGPIVIFKGGVYRGNWESTNPRVPAVTITTAQPVTIEHSNIRSRGPLIYSAFRKANVTVRHTRGEALNPGRPLREYRTPGRFIHLEEFGSLRAENNELIGTSGIYLREYRGVPRLKQTVKILRNRARNIDGRYSTGPNTFSDTRYHLVQFVQFNQVRHLPDAEIAWNEVINEPGRSRVEEVISMFLSSGTPSSAIKIHDNYIQGAFNVQPTVLDYGGAGMNLGDGSAKTARDAAAHIRAYNNQIVGTNTGIALSAGHDIVAFNNRLISSGYLPDGRPIRAQNVGIYVWDYYQNRRYGTFYNVVARDNVIGWARPLLGRTQQNPTWFPDCGRDARGRSPCVNNRVLPGRITLSTERDELRRWQAKVKAAAVRIGVIPK